MVSAKLFNDSFMFFALAYTHDPLRKEILEVIREPWGTFLCSMSSWERSSEVEIKAESGRVQGRNDFAQLGNFG